MDPDDAPPGFEDDAPPGFDELHTAVPPSQEATGEAGDLPDPSLKSHVLKDESNEIRTQTADNSMYTSAASFEELGLSPELLQGLYDEMKFEKPSRIQATTLPMILSPPYRHLIAQAHNGSGKTTCFVLAMLSRYVSSTALGLLPYVRCFIQISRRFVQRLFVVIQLLHRLSITNSLVHYDGFLGREYNFKLESSLYGILRS